MQNGHLIKVSALKNNALLTNLICGRGFGSVFRHQIQSETRLNRGFQTRFDGNGFHTVQL